MNLSLESPVMLLTVWKSMKQLMYNTTCYDNDILSVLSISSLLDPRYRSLSFWSNDEKESIKLAVEREAMPHLLVSQVQKRLCVETSQ